MDIENNKVIAEFMGWEVIENLSDFFVDCNPNNEQAPLQLLNEVFKDWNWLMEVVEKIESLKSPYDGFSWSIEPFSVLINRNNVYIQVDAGKSDDISFPDIHCKTKIELVYNTCVEFIKWYNQNSVSF